MGKRVRWLGLGVALGVGLTRRIAPRWAGARRHAPAGFGARSSLAERVRHATREGRRAMAARELELGWERRRNRHDHPERLPSHRPAPPRPRAGRPG